MYEIPRVVKFIETKSRMVAARGWDKGNKESYCLTDIEFQFYKMKEF